jgi:signal transduction histidine kinase
MTDDLSAQRQPDELAALYEVTQELSRHTLDLERILRLVVERAAQFAQVDSAGLYFYDDESEMLIGKVGYGRNQASVPGMHMPLAESGTAQEAIRTCDPVIVPDCARDARVPRAMIEQFGFKACLVVPILSWGHPIGLLFLDESRRVRPFTDQQVRLATGLAAQAAVAIENAHLYEAEGRRASELAALIEIERDISATLELPRVLERIARHAKEIVGVDDSDIYLLEPLFDPNAQTLRAVVSLSAYADEIMATPIKLGQGIVGSVAQRGLAEIVPHAEHDPRSFHIPGTPREPEALLYAPLVARGQGIGVMVLSRRSQQPFDEADLNFLVSLAQQASIAIHNAWLYAEAQRRTQELEALHQNALDVAAQLEMPRLLTTIVRRATELLEVDGGAIYLVEPDGQSLFLAAVHDMPELWVGTRLRLGEGGAGLVAQTGEPLIIEDYQTWRGRAAVYDPDIAGSVLEVPIQWGGRSVGVLACHTVAGARRAFDGEDIRLLQSFAQQVAVAVENARLFEAEQQRAAQLSQALERQQELDRLQAEFVQNVSHELRTPLALIRGYAEMLDRGELGELTGAQQEAVAIIARRSHSLVDLVEDITTILELEATRIEPAAVDMAQVTQQALADFRSWAGQKGIALRGEIATGLPPARGEARQLRKVVDNLVHNALKFTPEGGAVNVRLSHDARGVKLEVSDTGVGIPADQVERVFERFYQVNGSIQRRYGGTGLGLALVKEIVAAHGGMVTAESELERGSTFTVWLPLDERTA